jgi:outer membrane protein assembly factor BamB
MLRSSICLVVLFAIAMRSQAGNWPQWRGPGGNSVSDDTHLPLKWSPQDGISWKSQVPPGASTPAIWGRHIFITAQDGDRLLLLRLDRRNGNIDWSRQVARGQIRLRTARRGEQAFHNLHNLASPSPVTDGKIVIVHFGTGDLAAYDLNGNRLWTRNLQDAYGKYTIWWGHANSPTLCGSLLISVCIQDSLIDLGKTPSPSYVVAHDKQTGEEKWRTPRMTRATAEECDAYTTPIIHRSNGRAEVIVMGGRQIDSYDPATGKQLWVYAGIGGNRVITGPTLGDGLVYATTGMRGPLFALRLGGEGQLDARAIAWELRQGTPDSPCPVAWKDLLFVIADNGVAQCLDARTGQVHWRQRLPGQYRASPIAADGRVYFLNDAGKCTIVAAAAAYRKLAENDLADETIASPAVAHGCIYQRGKTMLYCIGRTDEGARRTSNQQDQRP